MGMKLEQLADIDMVNISKNFPFFVGLSTKSKPFLIHQPTAINQKLIRLLKKFT